MRGTFLRELLGKPYKGLYKVILKMRSGTSDKRLEEDLLFMRSLEMNRFPMMAERSPRFRLISNDSATGGF